MKNNSKNFAAIDIGSNAARLLISAVNFEQEKPTANKVMLLRYPLRLGEDVFRTGRIGKDKLDKTLELLRTYKCLMDLFEIVDYRACATSAMRDARNGRELANAIKKETAINVEIIGGQEEARIISTSYIADELDSDCCYLYVDVGGGSCEITVVVDREIKNSKSFNVGTLRMLAGAVDTEEYASLSEWVRKETKEYNQLKIVGLGGNINKLYRLAGASKEKLSSKQLTSLLNELSNLTVDERMKKYKLRADRADVIIPAAELFINTMKSSGASQIIVPTVGIVDGIIYHLYKNYASRHSMNGDTEV